MFKQLFPMIIHFNRLYYQRELYILYNISCLPVLVNPRGCIYRYNIFYNVFHGIVTLFGCSKTLCTEIIFTLIESLLKPSLQL